MRSTILLAQLALWTSGSHAFFPYFPSWVQELEERDLSETRRSVDGVSFEMKQRATNLGASPAEKAAWQAAFLTGKYAKKGPKKIATGSVGALSKRKNQYNIMEANDPSEEKAAGIHQDGTDYSYFVQAEVGSNGKKMYMLVDTGAGSSWVMGSKCTTKSCLMHNSFGPDDSSTLDATGKDFSVTYGSGSVSGTLATDTIKIAGMSLKYQFGLTTDTSDNFVHFAFDGILGLSMNEGSNENFLVALKENSLVEKNMFSIALNRAIDGSNTGEIKFGSTNPDKYTGDITYTPTTSKGDWSIPLDNLSFEGKKAGVGGMRAYIDTGTSYIFTTETAAKSVHAIIPGAASADGVTYTVPCDTKKPLVLTFSGVDFPISHKDWIAPKDNEGRCTSNIYGYEVVEGGWLLGDTFLKNVYAVFDKDQKRIGFATLAASGSGSSDSSSTSSTKTAKPATGTATTFITEVTSVNDGTSTTNPPPLGLTGPKTTGTGVPETTDSSDKDSSASGTFLQSSKVAPLMCILSLLIMLT